MCSDVIDGAVRDGRLLGRRPAVPPRGTGRRVARLAALDLAALCGRAPPGGRGGGGVGRRLGPVRGGVAVLRVQVCGGARALVSRGRIRTRLRFRLRLDERRQAADSDAQARVRRRVRRLRQRRASVHRHEVCQPGCVRPLPRARAAAARRCSRCCRTAKSLPKRIAVRVNRDGLNPVPNRSSSRSGSGSGSGSGWARARDRARAPDWCRLRVPRLLPRRLRLLQLLQAGR